jgi:hypothetical protein
MKDEMMNTTQSNGVEEELHKSEWPIITTSLTIVGCRWYIEENRRGMNVRL